MAFTFDGYTMVDISPAIKLKIGYMLIYIEQISESGFDCIKLNRNEFEELVNQIRINTDCKPK